MNRAKAAEDEKIRRRLKIESRALRAQQVRKANDYARQRLVQQMEATDKRISNMRGMKLALIEERKKNQRLEWIENEQWKKTRVLERAITPGPGDYALPSTLHVSGGTWGRYTPKSEIERIMERGRGAPGPGSYPLKSTLSPTGGSWSFYSPKSDIEWAQERAAAQPGPGEYDVRPKEYGFGMKFSEANPKSSLQSQIDAKRNMPGPGLYSSPMPKAIPKLAALIKKFRPSFQAASVIGKLKMGLKKKLDAKGSGESTEAADKDSEAATEPPAEAAEDEPTPLSQTT